MRQSVVLVTEAPRPPSGDLLTGRSPRIPNDSGHLSSFADLSTTQPRVTVVASNDRLAKFTYFPLSFPLQ